MKKLVLLLLLLNLSFVFGAMDPSRGFCEHQGFEIDEGFYENGTAYYFCVLDDETNCNMWDFYKGDCGADYVGEFDCVKEGESVFSEFEECCDGLKPYLPMGMLGQATCERSSEIIKGELK